MPEHLESKFYACQSLNFILLWKNVKVVSRGGFRERVNLGSYKEHLPMKLCLVYTITEINAPPGPKDLRSQSRTAP